MLSTDPIDLLLDPVTRDLVVTDDLALSSGVAGVVQSCRIAMSMYAGEWFLDLDFGVPWFERSGVPASKAIFGQKYNPAKTIAAFRAVLGAVAGVVAIKRLDVSFASATRTLTVTWAVSTAFGDTPVDVLALGQ